MNNDQELADALRRLHLMARNALDGSPSNFAWALSRIFEAAAIANVPPPDNWADTEPPDPYPESWQDRQAHDLGIKRYGEI